MLEKSGSTAQLRQRDLTVSSVTFRYLAVSGMGIQCKKVGEVCLEHIRQMHALAPVDLSRFRDSIIALLSMAGQLQNSMQRSSESVEDLVESELAAMDKAIEEAARKIEVCQLLNKIYTQQNNLVHSEFKISFFSQGNAVSLAQSRHRCQIGG